jgi:bifunctional DNase/RNase
MNPKDVVRIEIKALVPTPAGTAVFLGNSDKAFVIYVDPLVGSAITHQIEGGTTERPLTHDLIGLLLTGLGARIDRVVINDLKGATYYGRLIITVENELHQRKVLELDARPSDCLALAVRQKAPVYVTGAVWDEVEDMTPLLKGMEAGAREEGSEDSGKPGDLPPEESEGDAKGGKPGR